MDCFNDFCLACDRESTSGPYCSQACKLADLEKSNPVTPSTPTSQRSSWNGAGLVLPPAYDFSNRSSIYSDPGSSDERQQQSYFMRVLPRQPSQDSSFTRVLSPSSSRTSLSSASSDGSMSPNGLSAQAKLELQGYFNAFSMAQAAKRRSSVK